jgi:hypothetical protein
MMGCTSIIPPTAHAIELLTAGSGHVYHMLSLHWSPPYLLYLLLQEK